MPTVNSPHKGACHCKAVEFEVTLLDGLNTARRCTCSFCRMRGGVAVSAKMSDFRVTKGAEKLSAYQFNTNTAKHFFCAVCGIYTHHQRRSNPELFGVNMACLAGLSPFDLPEIPVLDGVNHPRDTGRGANAGVAGVLKFIKA